MKLCSRCNLLKPPASFHRDKQKVDGLYSSCKDCNIKNFETVYDGRLKYCTHCAIEKPVEDFSKSKRRRDGLQIKCRTCVRDRDLKRRFGSSLQEYKSLLSKQEGKCAICGKLNESIKSLHLDHCHKSGNIRGLLCANCNIGLGNFFDNRAFLFQAIEYLEKEYG